VLHFFLKKAALKEVQLSFLQNYLMLFVNYVTPIYSQRMTNMPLGSFRITINYLTVQVISCPQHIGDLIFPWPFGHFEICTSLLSSNFKLSLTSGSSHFAHVALTAIPHFEHSYVAIWKIGFRGRTAQIMIGCRK